MHSHGKPCIIRLVGEMYPCKLYGILCDVCANSLYQNSVIMQNNFYGKGDLMSSKATIDKARKSYAVYEAKRNALGLRNAQVARIAGVSYSCLCDWKHGTYTPKFENMQKIAAAVETTVGEIMEGQG